MCDPRDDSLVGQHLGHYRVEELIKRGGMGVVYRAWDERLGRPVAVKTIRPEIARNPTAQARLEREARAAATLSHPSIATLLDCERDKGRELFYLVFEYIPGPSLRDYQRRRRPGVVQVTEFCLQVARALAAAHGAGIIHRDIKPDNVVVLDEAHVKVLDFGLARLEPPVGAAPPRTGGAGRPGGTGATPAAVTLTGEGVLLGTLDYMSPEQLLGRKVDHRTDIYSLGVTLFELLAGRPPFATLSAAEAIASALGKEPPSLRSLNPRVPEALAAAVERCLSREPADRYASAQALAEDLDRILRELRAPDGREVTSLEAREYILPRGLARALFGLIQGSYLTMYLVALRKGAELRDALDGAFGTRLAGGALDGLAALILAVAVIGISVRLYLLALVGWDHVQTGPRYRKAFPVFFGLDVLWAAMPLLLLEPWGALALGCVAPLAFSPFGQRTLIRSAYDLNRGRRVSTG